VRKMMELAAARNMRALGHVHRAEATVAALIQRRYGGFDQLAPGCLWVLSPDFCTPVACSDI
jgi:hypothetical protein